MALRREAAIFISYGVVFAVLAAPLFPAFANALPVGPNREDNQLITWTLTWVFDALATDPTVVFDPPVAYPARGALAGTAHFFSSQILFAPIFAITGNPILAVNLAAWLTYPLAAFAMYRLLRALDFSPEVAWVGGIVFALAARRVPFNIHVLQYPNLFLPWVALALHRLRRHPTALRAAGVFAAYTLGIFASFYAAVLVGLTAALWAAFELLDRRPGRGRFFLLGLLVAVAGTGLLLAATGPYLEQAGALAGRTPKTFWLPLGSWREATDTAWMLLLAPFEAPGLRPRTSFDGWLALVAILGGIFACLARIAPARRVVPAGLLLWLLGVSLTVGYPSALAPVIAESPLSFFRFNIRYIVLGSFGLVLLQAATLSGLGALGGRPARIVACAALAAVTLGLRGTAVPGMAMAEPTSSSHAVVLEKVKSIIEENGPGPLLELPLMGPVEGDLRNLEADAMLNAERFGWATPASYLGYQKPHRWLFQRTAARLPLRSALQTIVDISHLRWILVRPDQFWKSPEQRQRMVDGLMESRVITRAWTVYGWLLAEISLRPEHPDWLETIRVGTPPDQTLLGAPLRPIDETDARSIVILEDLELSEDDRNLRLSMRIRNNGPVPWPVTPPAEHPATLGVAAPRGPDDHCVALEIEWRPQGQPEAPPLAQHRLRLHQDVEPGDSFVMGAILEVPEAATPLEVTVRPRQNQGARFSGPGNHFVRTTIP